MTKEEFLDALDKLEYPKFNPSKRDYRILPKYAYDMGIESKEGKDWIINVARQYDLYLVEYTKHGKRTWLVDGHGNLKLL